MTRLPRLILVSATPWPGLNRAKKISFPETFWKCSFCLTGGSPGNRFLVRCWVHGLVYGTFCSCAPNVRIFAVYIRTRWTHPAKKHSGNFLFFGSGNVPERFISLPGNLPSLVACSPNVCNAGSLRKTFGEHSRLVV